MKTKMKTLILSLKPCYAELVFNEHKTVELRRRIATDIENTEVFVYVSKPIMALYGGFRIGQVWSSSPEEIWNKVSKLAGIEQKDYDDYFEGARTAYALEIKEHWEYQTPISLNILKEKFPKFYAPMSWRYVRPEEHKYFIQTRRQT